MPNSYSPDLRQRVFIAWKKGEGTQKQIASRFAVSASFVRDLVRRVRQSGGIGTHPHAGGRRPLADGVALELMRELTITRPAATIEEHRRRLAAAGYPMSYATVARWLLRIRTAAGKSTRRR